MRLGNVGNMLVAAGAGAAIGSATSMVLGKTPIVGAMSGGLIGTAVGLYASYLVGRKFGSGMAGVAGMVLVSGMASGLLNSTTLTV